MDSEKKFELHLPSEHGCEKVAMDFAAAVATSVNFPKDRIEDLKTAIAEACFNAIEHGNKMDASTKVGMSLRADGDSLQVAIQDEATGVSGEVPVPPIDRHIEGTTVPAGWGRNLVKMIIHLDR